MVRTFLQWNLKTCDVCLLLWVATLETSRAFQNNKKPNGIEGATRLSMSIGDKKVAKVLILFKYHFSQSSKKLQIIWAIFVRKFVAKTFKNSQIW